ncbi:Alpha/Beta hydrolase protein [Paraphoma chrysanthemicola]|uniref:Carboxylic ester hydrolase n=1 Tax=Paraphoma chrysanthemicola TaxID=798071 RepID=A0A8K0VU31_9PLEO|nr:Alpha/Beta hydrolase protein [Paraphoma chrysanthemicola]
MADTSPGLPSNSADAPPKMRFSARWLKRRLVVIMTFFGTTLLLFWYFGAFSYGRPQLQNPTPHEPNRPNATLTVTLPGYGSFRGTQLLTDLKKTTTFNTAVDAWLDVQYSTQPVGSERFRPVTWPQPFDGVKDASAFGPACWQNVYSALPQSEACLSINVFRPSGVPIDQKLPSLVFLHGGSFVSGSHRSFDGAVFVEKSSQPVMVITAQYRLGALGTLPSKFMEEEGLLNLGVRDQRMMLEFLQKYVEYFGGDPNKITLGGLSAGGHSVGIHLFHNYGEDAGKSLFHQAILASGSPTARAFPGADYPLYQRQVENFMDYVNCPSTPNSAALECLRSAEVDDIQFISSSLYNAHNYNITWPWQPVSPGPLFEKRGSTSGEEGTFFKIPILISSSTNEGRAFAPQDLRSNAEYLAFWKTLTPGLSDQDFADLQTLYPDIQTSTESTTFVSPQFDRLSAAYGDYSYICPVQDTAQRLSQAGAKVYKARFNTPNWAPAFMGIPHASDASYFNGQDGTQYPEIADIYAAYWASFIVSGDPNTYSRPGSAFWDTYRVGEGDAYAELAVNRPGQGGPVLEDERTAIRMEQCAWWRDEERAKRLNK